MQLLSTEYERIIELQALALASAEKQLENLRESHDKAQRELRDLRRKVTSPSREVTP